MHLYSYLLCLFIFCSGLLAESLTDHEFMEVIQVYHKHMNTITDPQAKFDFALQSIPEYELYKLFIDKKRLLKPKDDEKNVQPHLMFDVMEPGYFNAMNKAFKSLPEYLGREIDLSLSIELHDKAVDGVKNHKGFLFPKGLSTEVHCYGITKTGGEPEKELIESAILFNSQSIKNLLKPSEPTIDVFGRIVDTLIQNRFMSELRMSFEINGMSVRSIVHTEKEWANLFNPIFDHHRNSVRQANTLDGLLASIGELLRALEVAHILPDGNTRTNSFLLLNKFLIEHNLMPVILEDPEMFGGSLTVAELTQAIRRGMKNFLDENPDFHRNFVNQSDVYVDDKWFKDNDYIPFHLNARPLNNVVKSFVDYYRDIIEESLKNNKLTTSGGQHSPLYFAILLGQNDLVEKLLSRAASVNLEIEDHPLITSLQVNQKVIPIILAYYKNAEVNEMSEEDLSKAFSWFRSCKKNSPQSSPTYRDEILGLFDQNNPIVPLTLDDFEKFNTLIKNDPHRLFDNIPGARSILLEVCEKGGDWLTALQQLALIERFSDDDLAKISSTIIYSIRALDELTLTHLLTLIKKYDLKKLFKENVDESNPIYVLINTFIKEPAHFKKGQFIQMFDILVDHGVDFKTGFKQVNRDLLSKKLNSLKKRRSVVANPASFNVLEKIEEVLRYQQSQD